MQLWHIFLLKIQTPQFVFNYNNGINGNNNLIINIHCVKIVRIRSDYYAVILLVIYALT